MSSDESEKSFNWEKGQSVPQKRAMKKSELEIEDLKKKMMGLYEFVKAKQESTKKESADRKSEAPNKKKPKKKPCKKIVAPVLQEEPKQQAILPIVTIAPQNPMAGLLALLAKKKWYEDHHKW